MTTFHKMILDISHFLTQDNVKALLFLYRLPLHTGNKLDIELDPLSVLIELERRGVFSHMSIEPLIGLLETIHRFDIINQCGVREYMETAKQHAREFTFCVTCRASRCKS